MNQHPMRRDAPGPITAASTPVEARKLAENLMEHMSALLAVIERETELVRAGKLREALEFEANKTDLSRRYVGAVGQLQANQKYLSQSSPELFATLHRNHDTFRAMLQINLTVLATAPPDGARRRARATSRRWRSAARCNRVVRRVPRITAIFLKFSRLYQPGIQRIF